MSKVILFLAFLCLAVLIAGSVFAQDSPGMWLASTTVNYNLLRLGLMIILFNLMLTDPPRHHIFRILVGIAAVSLSAWCFSATYENNMKLLDSASFLAASVSMGIVVLEYNSINKEINHSKVIREHQIHKRRHITVH